MTTTRGTDPNYQVSISKQELAALPAVQFKGNIVLVETPEGASQALGRLREEPVVGFDTETRPAFRKGVTRNVSLLQLCGKHTCYLIRLNKTGITPEIISFLEDENVLKVGLSTHDDFHNLQRMCEIMPKGFVELQTYVKDFLIQDNSLTKIHAILFGKRISKGQRLTNWEAPTLTRAQQSYAALDAQACMNIYTYLAEGNFVPSESKYYRLKDEEETEA